MIYLIRCIVNHTQHLQIGIKIDQNDIEFHWFSYKSILSVKDFLSLTWGIIIGSKHVFAIESMTKMRMHLQFKEQ